MPSALFAGHAVAAAMEHAHANGGVGMPPNAVNYPWSGTMIRDNKNSPFLPIWVFGKESQSKKERVYEDTQSLRA
ncbi:MAG: hypothetical protein NTY65_11190, partial [Planctomycetota bacterium]|nr:hypothetical protein [Planctomycetota bacterium]